MLRTGRELIDLYYEMLRIRLIEEEIADKYKQQQMRCPVHLSIGQEAVAVGVCKAVEPSTYVISTHRAHAHYLAKGGNLNSLTSELYGKASGCSAGKGGSMHLIDLAANFLASTPILCGSLPVAVGVSFASKMKKSSTITVAFLGEGATEEGTFAECLNFASLKKLPIIFVCENNLYSVFSPMSVRQSASRNRAKIAEAHGIPWKIEDGNDVQGVFSSTLDAVKLVSEKSGPFFLEFNTYRWREHCGPNYDNNVGYRTEKEFLKWQEKCPINNFERKLIQEKLLSNQLIADYKSAINEEIHQAFSFATSSPFPKVDTLYQHVYAT